LIDVLGLLDLDAAGLSGFALFVSISSIFLALLMIAVTYEHVFPSLTCSVKRVRVIFVIIGIETALSLITAYVHCP